MPLSQYFRRFREPRINRMLRRLRTDLDTYELMSGEQERRAAEQACEDCTEKEACERWLRSTHVSTEAPSFCPNKNRFDVEDARRS